MCSRSRHPDHWVFAAVLLAGLALAGCERERREYTTTPLPETTPAPVSVSELRPGAAQDFSPDPRGKHYQRNAYAISQGERLYRWFNCNGCHASGGGDIGPPLMDAQWRYGGSIDQIIASIIQGRPNGMPSFGGKIPPQQIWQLAAYVRALSGNVPKDAAPSRSDTISNTPPLDRLPKQPPVSEAPQK